MNTKERIIEQSKLLFNQHGYYNITIADIAQSCGMSRGNLTYHYKDKEKILADIAAEIADKIRSHQKERKEFPAFSNLNLDIKICGQLQTYYPFVFRDMNVMEEKALKHVIKSWSDSAIEQNIESFRFGLEIGNLKDESVEGLYYQLAVNTWMVTFYWINQRSVREVQALESAERMVWTTIYPHFTDKGREAFHGYFGDGYFSNKAELNYKSAAIH